jgi:uncharacterized membrane protein
MPIMSMSLARWVHLLGIVVWVGGMFFAHFALRPAAQELPPPVRLPLLAGVLQRFLRWAGAGVALVLVSGIAMSELLGGFRATGPAVHAMAALGVVMTMIYGHIVAAPYRRLRSAVTQGDWPAGGAAMTQIRRLVALNLALGIVTLAVGVMSRTLAT